MLDRNINKQEQTVGIHISNPSSGGGLCCHSDGCGGYGYTLERHLQSFANDNVYCFLWASWVTEKESYRKKLEVVPQTFATYSSHSADHSEIILARIEALLGEDRIRLLSPTDTWLLLQCAYTHDLGMCVSDKEKEEVFENVTQSIDSVVKFLGKEEFKSFLRETNGFARDFSKSQDEPLVTAIRYVLRVVESDDDMAKRKLANQLRKLSYSKAKHMLSTVIANFFRKKHAERTKELLMKEAYSRTLDGIFPVRLRQMVARIDYCHAGTWAEMMKELPNKNDGIHTDSIHPRFIAALLRLGDLLDMDSNRFNAYQIDSVGNMPASSIVHELKHVAITEFLVSPREIRIKANFGDKEMRQILLNHYFSKKTTGNNEEEEARKLINSAAKSLRSWIDWIQSDLKDFATEWNFIIPSNMTGSLAALRQHDIFVGNQDFPVDEDDLNLRYAISSMRASQLMVGADLYESPWSFVREITQNAIDAMKKHVIQHIDDSLLPEDRTTDDIYLKTYLGMKAWQDLKVKVSVNYIKKEHEVAKLHFCFEDRGIGISYEKLKQMRHIGAITKSPREKKMIENMPEWFQPTGEFGIGMQSIFAYTDYFDITTYPRNEKDRSNHIVRNIRFYCPELGGDIVSTERKKEDKKDKKDKKDNEMSRFGTRVEFDIELNRANIQSLLGYRPTNATDRRRNTVMLSSEIFDRLRHYIDTTFSDDVIPVEFSFLEDGKAIGNAINCAFPRFEAEPYVLAEESQRNYILYHGNNWVDFWYNKLAPKKDDSLEESEACRRHEENKEEKNEHILLQMCCSEKADSEVQLFYKGIRIMISKAKNDEADRMLSLFRIPNTLLKINIMSEKAGRLLELNRDRIKPGQHETVRKLIRNALVAFYVASADYAKAMMFKKTESEMTESEKNALEDFKQFWSSSAKHLKIFADIMKQRDAPLDQAIIQSIGCQNNGESLYVVLEDNGQVKVDSPCMENLAVLDGWFTNDKTLGAFGGLKTLLSVKKFEATVDNWSAWYGMYYREIRVVRENTNAPIILLYKLTDDVNSLPKISLPDYWILCRSIVEEYIEKYKKAKDTAEELRIGKSVLVFPAIKEYKKLAVRCVPIETPEELIGQYTHYILCPGTVEQLSKWGGEKEIFSKEPLGPTGEVAYNEAVDFVMKFFAPAENNEARREAYAKEYERFLDFLNGGKPSDSDSQDEIK